MSILEFAESELKVRLTYHQKELLILLGNNRNDYIHTIIMVKPRTQGILIVQEIYRKYNELIAS
ncbi:MAG: hypothetical protein K0Q73_4684 [Paenibacillus sp.]|jgi:alkylated DNA repair dioxygenase AlkB|nr:hypothetical protein [Paenibacillus sp.]